VSIGGERWAGTINVSGDRRAAAVTGVELIVAALTAGATAGITDTTSSLIRDSYGELRELLHHRFAGRTERAIQALDMTDADPAVWRAHVGADLIACGTDRDEEVLAAAARLLAELDPDGASVGKYRVDAREAKGVIVGDQAVQTNYFS
jgi:hypothetical protein